MRAEIISIGTEILMGEILDTNAQFIAQRLPAMGIDLFFMHQVGDNKQRLVDLITLARGRSDVVLCTGGLGPTEDDITRDAIAASIGEEPYVVPELEAHLRNFFEGRGGRMPEQNVKQATIVPSGESIPNPRGTAPGWWVEKNGANHRRDARTAGRDDRHVEQRGCAAPGRTQPRLGADLAHAQDHRAGRERAR